VGGSRDFGALKKTVFHSLYVWLCCGGLFMGLLDLDGFSARSEAFGTLLFFIGSDEVRIGRIRVLVVVCLV